MGKICIVHYHLNPGGVTRIIESQIRCLKGDDLSAGITVLTGHCHDPAVIESLGVKLVIDDCLNYLPEDLENYDQTLEDTKNFLSGQINRDDIIHFHNMNLGKNPLLTLAVSEMAKQGYHVLNHAHDFAEDRPANMSFLKKVIEGGLGMDLRAVTYPEIPNVLYATLNSADRKRLIGYRVDESRVFWLPNPVDFALSGMTGERSEAKPSICRQLDLDERNLLVTYPVRVIRRKNIGEYILLSVLFSEKANWVVTQPPKNPVEIKPYRVWKKFCREKNIDLVFEAGLKVGFGELIRASDWCFTTSIREGFGMVYMEPWLIGTPVGGRNIDYITSDLKASGMQFPLLYDKILIDTGGRRTDFAALDMDEQMNFISELLTKKEILEITLQDNPLLKSIFEPVEESIITNNQSIINHEYSLHQYAKRLKAIYQRFTL